MRWIRLLPATLAVVAVGSFLSTACANVPSQDSGPASASAWMPDVAERLASLRERLEQASAEARERSSTPASDEWWRRTIVRPRVERAR
jgi:hypothetical protein